MKGPAKHEVISASPMDEFGPMILSVMMQLFSVCVCSIRSDPVITDIVSTEHPHWSRVEEMHAPGPVKVFSFADESIVLSEIREVPDISVSSDMNEFLIDDVFIIRQFFPMYPQSMVQRFMYDEMKPA